MASVYSAGTMTKLLGVDFAPLFLPTERRLQTLAIIYYCSQFLIIGFAAFAILVGLAFTRFFFVPLIYVAWWMYDRKSPSRAGRRSIWVRQWRIWTWYRDYFPVSLIKTTELDPTRNYILGIHPHGILCFGSFLNFATEATDFSQKFPGIRPFLLTLEAQFFMPLHRELFLLTGKWYVCNKLAISNHVHASGSCSATRESMEWLLKKECTGTDRWWGS